MSLEYAPGGIPIGSALQSHASKSLAGHFLTVEDVGKPRAATDGYRCGKVDAHICHQIDDRDLGNGSGTPEIAPFTGAATYSTSSLGRHNLVTGETAQRGV